MHADSALCWNQVINYDMPEDRAAHLCTVAVGTNQDQPRVTVDVKGERNMMRKMIFMKRKLMKEKHHIYGGFLK